METLQISPSILRWAADQRGLSLDALVDLLGKPTKPVKPEKRAALVAGRFSLTEAETLAKKTHIPFGYLFLDAPPDTAQRTLPDLRQLPNHAPLSLDFFDVLDDVLRKQQWYQDYLQEHGAQKLDFVGKYPFNAKLPAAQIAADIRHTLDMNEQERKQCKTYGEFFSLLSTKAENSGLLVFKNSIVKNNTHRSLSVSEFRGFAIADPLAPVIFINGKDSEAAWIFTLAHEIAHIWLGKSGVSDLPANQQQSGNALEIYCNRIAAELLTPESGFLAAWEQATTPKFDTLSKIFKVSQLVIARRALDLEKIDWATYQRIAAATNKATKSDSGGHPYRTYPVRNSKRLTRALVTSAMSGNTLLRKAATLLNVRPETVMELSKKLGDSMKPSTRYLIDANVFIQAKNFHYRFEFCQAFWQWLNDAHQADLVFSINKVRQELNDGNDDDPVRLWINELPDSFFIPDTADSHVMQAYGQVMQWNVSNSHYRRQAKDEFARHDNADAFLIAVAKAHGFTIITHEIGNPDSKKRVMIPDAANQFGIQSPFIYDLLTNYAQGNFSLNL